MDNNYDEQWEEMDDDEIKECIFIETQTLSQASSVKEGSISSSQNQLIKSSSKYDALQFPSVSSFNDDFPSQRMKNLRNVQSFPKSLNNKVYNTIPLKGGIFNSNCGQKPNHPVLNTQSKTYAINGRKVENTNEATHDHENQLEKVNREKEKIEEENLIKQGEVYYLRGELKKKEAALETERVDHCLALEAAEKRGKEKSVNSLKESEFKVKKLQVEIEKLYGSIAFKNREVEELLARCQQLEQLQQNSNNGKKPIEMSQSSKRFKRELEAKNSPPKLAANFSDKFDFYNNKRETKDVQIQTNGSGCRRLNLPTFSKKGKMSCSKKGLIVALENHQNEKSFNLDGSSKLRFLKEDILLLHSHKGALTSSLDASDTPDSHSFASDNYIIKSVCIQLEDILKQCNKDKNKDAKNYYAREEYIELVTPLFNILRNMSTQQESLLFDVINILAEHISLICLGKEFNKTCLFSALESILSFCRCCNTLPTSISVLISQSLDYCLQHLDSYANGKTLLIETFTSCIHIESFKREICKNKARKYAKSPCLLTRICTLFATRTKVCGEDCVQHMIIFISNILQPPNDWLECSCSLNLLHTLVKRLYSLSILPLDLDESPWHLLVLGIKILHRWQLMDINWWDKIAPLPSYTILMGTVVRTCKIAKANGTLDPFIWDLLYDLGLHEADDS